MTEVMALHAAVALAASSTSSASTRAACRCLTRLEYRRPFAAGHLHPSRLAIPCATARVASRVLARPRAENVMNHRIGAEFGGHETGAKAHTCCRMRRMSLAVVVRWSFVAVGLAVSVSVGGCGAG